MAEREASCINYHRAHMYSFCLTMLGILLDISGHAHQVKEMTTSSTVILLTKRYPNPNDCKSGTRRCWTSLCQSALSTITRFVKCMFVLWEGFDQSHPHFFFSLPYALSDSGSVLHQF